MEAIKIELTQNEYSSLNECLTILRKKIDHEYQYSEDKNKIQPIDNPIFKAACELQFKFAKAQDPSTKVTLDDYLEYGRY
jgi:hypothetical protein